MGLSFIWLIPVAQHHPPETQLRSLLPDMPGTTTRTACSGRTLRRAVTGHHRTRKGRQVSQARQVPNELEQFCALLRDLRNKCGQPSLAVMRRSMPSAPGTSTLSDLLNGKIRRPPRWEPAGRDILPALPPDLKARLFEAFDLQILWNKPGNQATVFAEITDATLQALPGILNPGQDGYDDTSEESVRDPVIVEDLFEAPLVPNPPRSLNSPT